MYGVVVDSRILCVLGYSVRVEFTLFRGSGFRRGPGSKRIGGGGDLQANVLS